MTLSELVPTLEVCQQLKAAGFPQDTALCWSHYGHTVHWGLLTREQAQSYARMNDDSDVPAPTAGELMEWLKNLASECAGPAVRWEPECWMADFDHEEDAGEHAVEDTLIAALAALVLEVRDELRHDER